MFGYDRPVVLGSKRRDVLNHTTIIPGEGLNLLSGFGSWLVVRIDGKDHVIPGYLSIESIFG